MSRRKPNTRSARNAAVLPGDPSAHLWGVQWDEATLRLFALKRAVESGNAPDADTLRWLADAVGVLAEHGDARQRRVRFGTALGIEASAGSGQPKKNTGTDEARIYAAVGFAIQREEKLIAQGVGKSEASKLANEYAAQRMLERGDRRASVRSIQSWRKAHGERVAQMLHEYSVRMEVEAENARDIHRMIERIAPKKS